MQGRQTGKPRLHRQKRGELTSGFRLALQCWQSHGMAFMERTDRRTPQRHDMAITAQRSTYVARQRSNVGSLAAFGRKDRLIGIGH